ncbi:MAG: AAA family ATPase [Tenuifilaceae bacterium]|nr:AAA family ATPase [Tenuifilaceae bacterium]
MEQKRLKSNYLIASVPTQFSRSIASDIDWKLRLIGLLGPRGTGKTTLLLQAIKQLYGFDPKAIYINLNDLYFADGNLQSFVAKFCSMGGEHIFIDNVHKHPNWSNEIKRIYENFPNLRIAFAGSSTIDMLKHYANLSQRATIYQVNNLSFREYLSMQGIINLEQISLDEIIRNHSAISNDIPTDLKILPLFDKYLTQGAYPMQNSSYEEIKKTVEGYVINTIELDMVNMEGYDSRNGFKLKQLMSIIGQKAPFKPNLVSISNTINLHRNTLIGYLFHLEKAKLINLIYPSGSAISILQKPERIFMGNPNMSVLLGASQQNRSGLLRTFAVNQLLSNHELRLSQYESIEVDGQILLGFETNKRIPKKLRENPQTVTLVDGIEIGSNQRVPIWTLGLLS